MTCVYWFRLDLIRKFNYLVKLRGHVSSVFDNSAKHPTKSMRVSKENDECYQLSTHGDFFDI